MKTHSAGALAVGMWHGSSIIGTHTNRTALLHVSHFESRALRLHISRRRNARIDGFTCEAQKRINHRALDKFAHNCVRSGATNLAYNMSVSIAGPAVEQDLSHEKSRSNHVGSMLM